ncbi:hypothetical protein [Acuticoccus sediminis]|uniref:hypothetical protein n=1 Tax=Acuticoccus sediminis TaxID=2184697 RepID=UPI001CFCC44D|nr:hypothetical protein [Acuticoccus sediminis]
MKRFLKAYRPDVLIGNLRGRSLPCEHGRDRVPPLPADPLAGDGRWEADGAFPRGDGRGAQAPAACGTFVYAGGGAVETLAQFNLFRDVIDVSATGVTAFAGLDLRTRDWGTVILFADGGEIVLPAVPRSALTEKNFVFAATPTAETTGRTPGDGTDGSTRTGGTGEAAVRGSAAPAGGARSENGTVVHLAAGPPDTGDSVLRGPAPARPLHRKAGAR